MPMVGADDPSFVLYGETIAAVDGVVRNAAGAVKVAQLQTSNGYALTVHSALHVVQALLAEAPAGGYYTPAQLLGWQLVEHLPDCGKIVIH